MTMIILMTTTISILAMLSIHPLSLGLCLLIQTIMYALVSGLLSKNFWFSYILFLMMVSGMLVLFLYMTSISSNKKFNFPLITTPLTVTIMTLSYMMTPYFLNYPMMQALPYSYVSFPLLINNYFNFPLNILMITLMIYLLLTLIVSVKITNIKAGPLRQKF